MFRGRGGALFGSNQVSVIKIECCKNIRIFKCFYNTPFIMRVAGLEPARYRYRGILSPLCLPIPPHPQRTDVLICMPRLKTRTFTRCALMSLSYDRHASGRRWIRTTEAISSRFTVCPLWPLGNSPRVCFNKQ